MNNKKSNYDYVDDPTVAAGDDNEILLAWVEQDKQDVYFRRMAADGSDFLSKPINISNNPKTTRDDPNHGSCHPI